MRSVLEEKKNEKAIFSKKKKKSFLRIESCGQKVYVFGQKTEKSLHRKGVNQKSLFYGDILRGVIKTVRN